MGPDQQVAEGRQEAGGDVSDVSSICDPHPACDIMTLLPGHETWRPGAITNYVSASFLKHFYLIRMIFLLNIKFR